MSSTNNSPVLFIARVFPNIHEKRIRGIIGALKIGSVDRVDMKPWTNKEGKSFNKVYIHLNWNTDAETIKIVNRLNDGKDIKIVYDDPWFWKASAYKNTNEGQKRRPKAKIIIQDDDDSAPDSDAQSEDREEGQIREDIQKSAKTPLSNNNVNYGGSKAIPKRRGRPQKVKTEVKLESDQNPSQVVEDV